VPQILRAKTAFSNKDIEKMTELAKKVIDETEMLAKEHNKEGIVICR
jgi:hypothetical protein